jgi:hypothetical protein
MDPSNVAARFLAFMVYLNDERNENRSPEEAGRYARRSWEWFLPYVDEDLARFLAEPPSSSSKSTYGRPELATKTPRRNMAV